MRTLLALLVSSVVGLAQLGGLGDPAFVADMTVPVASGGCDTSDTTLPHSVFLEGWNGTGAENTWATFNATADVTVDEDADTSALTTNKPDGACDEAVSFDLGGNGDDETRYTDVGAIDVDAEAVDVYFYIYIDTALDNGESVTVMVFGSGTNPGSGGCVSVTHERTAGGVNQLKASGSTTSTSINMDAGWNYVKISLDTAQAAGGSSLTVNATTQTFQRAAVDPRYLHFGAAGSYAAGEACKFYIDLAAIDKP